MNPRERLTTSCSGWHSEPRKDGKASPLVGAVLRKPDGTVETACRGELRHARRVSGTHRSQ